MKSHTSTFFVALGILVLAQGAPAQSITNTWNGSFGSWNNAANWIPNGVPNNTNGARYTVTVGSGGPTLASDILLDTLNYAGGDISGQFNLTVNKTLNLAGNTDRVLGVNELILPAGSQTVWLNASFAIWGSSQLLNYGTFTYQTISNESITIDPLHTGGDGHDTFGGTIFNEAGGVFIVAGSQQLTVGTAFNNSGTVVQNTGSVLYNGNVLNTGTVQQNSGTVLVNGQFTQTAGSYTVGSNAVLSGNINFTGGRLGGVGTISPYGNLSPTTGAVLDPGNSPGSAGRLTITTKLVLAGGGVLHADIGGTTAGSTYDQVVTANFPSLDGGVLEISLVNHFTPAPSDQFIILTTSDGSFLSGSFTNVANGFRLLTTDDDGSFLVLYGTGPNANNVVLTDFAATPEPGIPALLAAGACCRLLIRRPTAATPSSIRNQRTPTAIS